MTQRVVPRGLAREARPLLLSVAGASLAAVLIGCAGPPPPPPTDGAPGGELKPESSAPPGHVLVIEPVADETASREVRSALMEDFRGEVRAALAGIGLFSDVRTEAAGAPEPLLLLRPVLLLERVAGSADQAPVVEMEVRFELRVSGSRGLVWRAEYREQSPQEILYQSPFHDRQRFIATQAIRRRILISLRRDLTRFLLAY